MTKKTFYITTTIPYANAPPHIGFALEIIQADVIARWKALNDYETFFLTGTDEHGTKNYKTAKEQGLSPQEFVDKNANSFKELTKSLNISNNNFIRTTDKKTHWPGVIELWNILEKKGDIYKKQYSGNYCSGCERFITDKELEDGKCPNHPNIHIQQISEENYFFKLSKYSKKITELIKKDKLKISPTKWKNDFLALIKDGLTDVSFSRDKKILPWGVPVPNDKNQVIYVWCDALTNYLTGISYPDKEYKKFWPANIHVVGKDMLRFHTGIWPGMLLSAGLELPKEVIVHGFLTVSGQKMSKSLGNVTSPLELRKTYPADSIRYTLMRATPFGDDGDFSEQALADRHNNELADKLGNLVSRVSALAEKYPLTKTTNTLSKKLNIKKINIYFDNYELDKALNEIFAFIDNCNEYVQSKKPWVTHDTKVLYELADAIKSIAILLSPFIPETAEKIAKIFNFKIDLKQLTTPLKPSKIKKSPILFQKIDKPTSPDNNVEGITTMSSIPFNEFSKIDLRVAQIKKAEDIEGKDKLYKLQIDLGKEKRTIVAGIKQNYTKEELAGKKIIVVANLEPAKLAGIESNGMLLAAVSEDHKNITLIAPEKDMPAGTKIS